MSQPINDLDRAAGYALKELDALLRAEMDVVLRPLGLTVPQYATLEVLGQRPRLTSAELAREAFVSRQSMHVMLRTMTEAGWVRLASTTSTGRARPRELTAKGKTVLDPASRAVREVERRMEQHLNNAQRRDLRSLLAECVRGLRDL